MWNLLGGEICAWLVVGDGVLVLVVLVWFLVWKRKMRRALGFRRDWKRRFDRMREMLGL